MSGDRDASVFDPADPYAARSCEIGSGAGMFHHDTQVDWSVE